MKANLIILLSWIMVDYFIGIELKSLLIGILSVMLYEPLKQKLNETR